MDDMDAFDRQIAREVVGTVRSPRHVDHLAIFATVSATQSPKWRFQSMFSATKFVVAGAIVALFGGFLLAGLLATQPSDELAPAASTTSGPGVFSPTDSLDEARSGHTATLLTDGRVLVVGGEYPDEEGDNIALHAVSAEVWDPATASFSPAGSLAEARSGHTATSLPDGRVLVVGGYAFDDCDGYCFHNIADAEVWDSETASFSPAGSLAKERGGHTATLLPDGRVLIVGGVDGYGMVGSAEVWDPETASFSPAGSLAGAMAGHTAALRPDGGVLIVGTNRVSALASAEVWDPAAAAFVSIGSFGYPEDGYSATDPAFAPLPDGRVLIAGGGYIADANGVDQGYEVVATAAIWDQETTSFDVEGSLIEAREHHTATLLSDGRVLVVGGWDGEDGKRASAEVWDPETASFSPAGSLAEGRDDHTATPLPDGRVLVVGGWGADSLLASAEVWSP